VLLPLEDVPVFSGTVHDGSLTRVVVLCCVVLAEFKIGRLRNTGTPIAGDIFLGIGDFTFDKSPIAIPVASAVGDGWMIYMY
jgi:hypothetical protein